MMEKERQQNDSLVNGSVFPGQSGSADGSSPTGTSGLPAPPQHGKAFTLGRSRSAAAERPRVPAPPAVSPRRGTLPQQFDKSAAPFPPGVWSRTGAVLDQHGGSIVSRLDLSQLAAAGRLLKGSACVQGQCMQGEPCKVSRAR